MMKKYLFVGFIFLFFSSSFSQSLQKTLKNNKSKSNDSTQNESNNQPYSKKNKDATIDLYKIISHELDTTYVDTTLSIKKEYKFNYLRKDNLELLPFSNMGQSYNTLSYHFHKEQTLPLFGARARHFNYMEIEDINYYHVPTPFTELLYKSAFEQGQLLDAFFTVNTTAQFRSEERRAGKEVR